MNDGPDDPPRASGPAVGHDDHSSRAIAEITRRLAARFDATLAEDVVDAVVRTIYQRLAAHARITAFLPTLTERAATQELLRIEHSERRVTAEADPGG